jgi:hypothetical protein
MDNSRLEKIKKWFDDWGEIEENDFNWITDRLEGYILAYEVIVKSNERMEKEIKKYEDYFKENSVENIEKKMQPYYEEMAKYLNSK